MLELYWRLVELDWTLHFACPLLIGPLTYWNEKRGARLMPSRGDIDPTDMALREHLGMIVLTDVIGEPPRFRYRLIGSKITAMIGRDATGRWLDEIYSPSVFEDRIRTYNWVVQHRAPVRAASRFRLANAQWVQAETLILPLSSGGQHVDMILSVSRVLGRVAHEDPVPPLTA